jgi:hypothetical protein
MNYSNFFSQFIKRIEDSNLLVSVHQSSNGLIVKLTAEKHGVSKEGVQFPALGLEKLVSVFDELIGVRNTAHQMG